MLPTISVIIPVYNVELYIRQCLDSIVNQTYKNLEIIVIDDGSPDNSGTICDEYAEKDSRIIVIHKENGGVNSARNLGIERATGEWIAFVDSDDWCNIDYYERFINEIGDTDPDIFQACGFIYEYPNKSKLEYNFKRAYQAVNKTAIENLMMGITQIGLPWDKLYKRSFICNNHLMFDISCKSLDDHLFNFYAYNHAKNVAGSVFAGYHYRQIAMSISKGFNPQKGKQSYEAITKLHDYIYQNGLPEKIKVAPDTDAIIAILVTLKCDFFHPKNNKSYKEIANEIKEMKKWPYYHEAIWSGNSKYLNLKKRILKYALRLPWVWPIKAVYTLRHILN